MYSSVLFLLISPLLHSFCALEPLTVDSCLGVRGGLRSRFTKIGSRFLHGSLGAFSDVRGRINRLLIWVYVSQLSMSQCDVNVLVLIVCKSA